MIDLYTWTTPNGRKVSILLEELGVDYTAHAVDIGADEQFAPDFLKISPNNKIPAIVDRETGISVMETGAIMLYLADKYKKFMPIGEAERWQAIEWLMWQMAGFGPMLGQGHHFLHFNPGKAPYAEERFGKEANRLYSVLNKRLADKDYIVGDYSVVDMACWPWASRYEWHGVDISAYPNVAEWYNRIRERPAVQRGYQVPKDMGEIPKA
ncbi:MAG: glutathione S-transferase N-terminal domain-containing protein [Pseudomonadota bacterium]